MSAAEAELAIRRWGHLVAKTDPLGRTSAAADRAVLGDAPRALSEDRLQAMLATYAGGIGAEFEHIESAAERDWWRKQLEAASGADGSSQPFALSPAERRNALTTSLKAETFELFLAKKFPSFKRYSGEGTEGVLLAADALFAAAAKAGVSDIAVGEAHRGRLAMLACLLDYPARKLLWKIAGNDDIPAGVQGVDDVSSHVYTSVIKAYTATGAPAPAPAVGTSHAPAGTTAVRVSLLPNPSHLEAVNPVAAGKIRAKRDRDVAEGRNPSALCLLVHGDAACSGQGVVAECYAMANLPGYTVGGTIHIIANNQIGYTAEGQPLDGTAANGATAACGAGRSSRYASDMAKVISAPVLHVNGESVRDVILATRLALAYRQTFGKDVVLDVLGYRRHGHNEVDEPAFTNPGLYKAIRSRPSFTTAYAEALVKAGDISAASLAALKAKLEAHLEAEFQASKSFTSESGCTGVGNMAPTAAPGTHVVGDGTAFGGLWSSMRQATLEEMHVQPSTGVAVDTLRYVAGASVAVPPGFVIHERLVRSHIKPRQELAKGGPSPAVPDTAPAVDWSTAESMAIGSLLLEGHPVRMSGQDVERGTFSQRHAVLVDQATGARHCPLATMPVPASAPDSIKAKPSLPFYPVSSLLSEFAVMGYELGYSWDSPAPLVAWEAQFGDFGNGAQIIIDQFLSGSESKWLRQTGLTLLLPHGYDGAGPEHSSGRIERFLQLVNSQAWARGWGSGGDKAGFAGGAADKCVSEALNMRVAIPTTPANYFHLLRRQQAVPYRKPLVVFTPKTLLRATGALSSLTEMGPGTAFQPVLHDVWPPGADGVAKPGAAAPAFTVDSRDPATAARINRVLLCSGKVYHELGKRREEVVSKGAGSAAAERAAATAIIRVEEVAPWPAQAILHTLSSFPSLTEVAWVQEEPSNAGVYTWAEAHMRPVLAQLQARLGTGKGKGGKGKLAHGVELPYLGRPALPAPAVGMGKRNKAQQEALLAAAFPAAV